MSEIEGRQTALLLICPNAEPVVGALRQRLDPAARDGVPAHITVIFPFVAERDLTPAVHDRVAAIAAATPPLELTASTTGWFGDAVLFVPPDDPGPIITLTERVAAAFPDHPPYGGAYDEITPHLTVGIDATPAELHAAEPEVVARLPFRQRLDHVELWAGLPLGDRAVPEPWQYVRSYAFGG